MDNRHNIPEGRAGDLERLAKGAGTSFLGSLAGKGLWFACQIIIARSLGAEAFGVYILGVTVFRVVEFIPRLGLAVGSMRFVSIYRGENPAKLKGTLISSFVLPLASGVAVGAVLYACAWPIAGHVFGKPELVHVIRAFSFCVPLSASMLVAATATQGFQTTKYSVYTKDVVQPLTFFALVLLLTWLGSGLTVIVYAFVLSHAAGLAAAAYFTSRLFPGVKDRALRPAWDTRGLMSYSLPIFLSGFMPFLVSWTDVVILGVLMPAREVAAYRAAVGVSLFLPVFLAAANSIYAPSAAEAFQSRDMDRLERLFETSTRWSFYLVMPSAIVIVFSAPEIMSVYGPGFAERGAPALMVLCAAQLVNCLTGGVGLTLNVTGRQKVEFYNGLAALAANVLLNVLLIPAYGVLGSAFATGAALAGVNLLRLAEVFLLYRVHPYSRLYFKGVFAGVVSITVLLLLGMYVKGLPPAAALSLKALSVCTVFASVFIAAGFSDDDRYILSRVRDKLRLAVFNASQSRP